MRNRFFVILPAMLLVAFMALGVASCGSSGASQFSKEVQENLNKSVDAIMAKYRVPGAILGAWVPGKGQWVVTKGKANTATGAAPKTTDHIRIASITKTFTATVILQLADEGKLKLDDKLDKFDLGLNVPNSDKITIRNLLNMTSGLFSYTADENFWNTYTQNPRKPWTPQELVEISIAHGAVAAPGGEYDYNNTNYVLLGLIIEKLTGNAAGKEITTRIIDKLAMKNTSYPESDAMPSEFMHGYTPDPEGAGSAPATMDVSISTPTAGYTAGAIISTQADIKRWLEALRSGELLSPAMHKEQATFGPPNTANYGLGLMGFTSFIGHSGEILGYNNAAYTQTKENGVTIIVFINRYPNAVEGVPEQILAAIAEALGPVLGK